jgi:hypothetical protein
MGYAPGSYLLGTHSTQGLVGTSSAIAAFSTVDRSELASSSFPRPNPEARLAQLELGSSYLDLA